MFGCAWVFELVAERGEAQQDLTPLFAELRNDNPQKNDGVFDIDNMPLTEEPECVINDLNLMSVSKFWTVQGRY